MPRSGDAAEAHAAGAQDVAAELATPTVAAPPPVIEPLVINPRPVAVERDHDQTDPHRYNPLQPPAGYVAQKSPETVTADAPAEARSQLKPPPDDVMVLPQPNLQNRPTVSLDQPMPARPRQAAVPLARPTERLPLVRPTVPLPPPTGSPDTDARLERLENSPFWRDPVDDTIEVPPGEEPPPVLTGPRHRDRSRSRARRQTGRPVSAQISLVALGLVAAFFAWVSAEPFWLAVNHGDQGYVTTTRCTGDGVTQRCAGRFADAGGRYTITQVRLLGVEGQARQPGAVTPARMVSPDSRQAYVGGTGPLLQLRWLLGFALVLLCGYAIAGVTGARRLDTARARRGAVLLSLAGPLVLLAGFLVAAY